MQKLFLNGLLWTWYSLSFARCWGTEKSAASTLRPPENKSSFWWGEGVGVGGCLQEGSCASAGSSERVPRGQRALASLRARPTFWLLQTSLLHNLAILGPHAWFNAVAILKFLILEQRGPALWFYTWPHVLCSWAWQNSSLTRWEICKIKWDRILHFRWNKLCSWKAT